MLSLPWPADDDQPHVLAPSSGKSAQASSLEPTGAAVGKEAAFDALAAAAARLTERPIALIALLEGDRLRMQAVHGAPSHGAAHDPPLSLVTRREDFDMGDLTLEPDWQHHAWVAGALGLRSCAGIALTDDEGLPLGALCVLDARPGLLSATRRGALQALMPLARELLLESRHALGLAADRERLRDFARASGDWMWETDGDLRYQWIAGAYEAITGQPPEAVLGQRVGDAPLLDAFGHPQSDRRFHELLEAHAPFTRVLTEKLTPRGRLVISRSAVPVFDAAGTFRGWRGTARDMTARLDAANRARSQAELLQQLSEQAPGVIFQLRRQGQGDGIFQFISERIEDLFGIPHAELMQDASRLFDAIHAEDLPRVRDALQIHERAMRPMEIEFRVVRTDGRERWMACSMSPERQGDDTVVWRGFVADTTVRKTIELALRASEERWALAADAAGIGIAQLDPSTGLLQFDARACANHGLRYPHPTYSLSEWAESIHADDRRSVQAALLQALQGADRFDTRYRFARPDGSEHWLEITARVRRDSQGWPLSVIGTCRDVTDPMTTEALRRDKEAAERASQAKSEFLSRVSHELRTPLNGILGFAQLMALDRAHPLADEQQRRLDGVQQAGKHLLALINDVLDIARIEQGGFALQLKSTDATRVIAACLSLIQPLAAARGVRMPAPPTGPCWVRADARSLEQVLMNLLSNAIKYNRIGGAVHLDLARPDDGHVALTVRDEGDGLTEQQQSQLFQPFNRLGAERQRIEGSGLGLVIARQLAEAMQGSLTMNSQHGAGCRFTITLEAAEAGSSPAHDLAVSAALSGGTDEHPRHVLYVEDEPLNALLMQELFNTLRGWSLHVARDGAQGLAMARSLRPDLVVVDMDLPDMSGTDVLRRLRGDAELAALRCVALSANAMHEQIAAARSAGFDDYWTKPVDVAQLTQKLSAMLRENAAAEAQPDPA